MTATITSVLREPLAGGVGEIWNGDPDMAIEDLPARDIAAALRKNGALLFRGFQGDTSAFKRFTDGLCPDFMKYEGGASARKKVDGHETLLTVTEPSMLHGIPLHGEMYYMKNRPSVLFFYCKTPASKDGETTVADGVALYHGLKPETRRYFSEHKIKYLCTYPDGRWQQLFHTDAPEDVEAHCKANDLDFHLQPDNSVVTEYVSSAISQPLYCDEPSFINNIFTMVRWEQAGFGQRLVRDENGEPLADEIIEELQDLEQRLTYPVAWRPGDIMMVDNTRMLHGRRAFDDTGRTIFVRLGGRLPEFA